MEKRSFDGNRKLKNKYKFEWFSLMGEYNNQRKRKVQLNGGTKQSLSDL